jgi:hypothetical protein
LHLGHGGFLLALPHWAQFGAKQDETTEQEHNMGLDCYWAKPGERKSNPLDFDPPLCIEDDHDRQSRREGWAHFRGRACHFAIEQITGVSLYSRGLDNATVRAMAERLEAYAAKPWPLPPTPDLDLAGWEFQSKERLGDLARLFRAYADAGYELHGSW